MVRQIPLTNQVLMTKDEYRALRARPHRFSQQLRDYAASPTVAREVLAQEWGLASARSLHTLGDDHVMIRAMQRGLRRFIALVEGRDQ